MRIVIDLQGAQTSGSRHRGIGRYTLALTKEMLRQRGDHDVVLVLNGQFADSIEPIRAAFANLLPDENIRIWESASNLRGDDLANTARRKAAEMTSEAFLVNLKPDVIFYTSVFEGFGDDAIASIGTFTRAVPSVVILYDLIPLIYRDIYLNNSIANRFYFNRLEHLCRAELLLSISASSRQEAIDHLGLPEASVVNISTACDDQFHPIKVDEQKRDELKKSYGLVRPFVMYTGGIDHRKNIEGLIRAYAMLPNDVRKLHQLAVVCSARPVDQDRLQQLAKQVGLGVDELVMTGFVPEEDLLALYNTCKLFVFPSWHEGFGLPALEAMACGCAVIGANTSSVPEVIARESAMFDPHDDAAISRKIEQVLTDVNFRLKLQQEGLEQAKKFSWEQTARRAWDSLEALISQRKQAALTLDLPQSTALTKRPRLAYVSPMPPEQSGISGYSAELLPVLAKHYEIEVIVASKHALDACTPINFPTHDAAWFSEHARRFDRVLYHVGNSHFHSHMFDLMREIPGVVMLHDFFLSGVIADMELRGVDEHILARSIFHSHGWPALQQRFLSKDIWTDVTPAYPCNLSVLQQAMGVIVHSESPRRLANKWYGAELAKDWTIIPHLRVPATKIDRRAARNKLGFADDDFVACSFGLLDPLKLNHQLINAWLASPLADNKNCHLIFVGENPAGKVGADLVHSFSSIEAGQRIQITGWVDDQQYKRWLSAADVGVQLRAALRGETSGAVIDCMNYGLATIVNATGAMADMPSYAVLKLPETFSQEQLMQALTTLWKDVDYRTSLGQQGQNLIHTEHQPRHCAAQYAYAIERSYRAQATKLPALVSAVADIEPRLSSDDLPSVAAMLAKSFPPRFRRRQLLVDISEFIANDVKNNSATSHSTSALLRTLLLAAPEGWAIEPIYAAPDAAGYRYAHSFVSKFLGIDERWAEDEPAEAWRDDIFLALDIPILMSQMLSTQKEQLLSWHRQDIKQFFVLRHPPDLLPALKLSLQPSLKSHPQQQPRPPQVMTKGINALNQQSLEIMNHFDGAICSSQTIADDFYNQLKASGTDCNRSFALNWVGSANALKQQTTNTNQPNDAHSQADAEPEIAWSPSASQLISAITAKTPYRLWQWHERSQNANVDVTL